MNNNSLNPQQMAFGFLSGFFLAGSRTLAVTITVFTRYKFGDRYFTFGTFLSGLVGLWLVNWISGLLGIVNMFTGGLSNMFMGAVGYKQPVTFFGAIIPLYIAASLFHLARIAIGNLRGEVWWGNCTGLPWLGKAREFGFVRESKILNWLFSDWVLYRFVEPAVFFLLGQLVGNVLHDQFTSAWLIGASVGLFLNNKALVDQQKTKLKDMRDAQIESRFLADALAGKDKQLIHGYSVLPVSKEQHSFFFGKQQPVEQAKPAAPDIATTVAETMNPVPKAVG